MRRRSQRLFPFLVALLLAVGSCTGLQLPGSSGGGAPTPPPSPTASLLQPSPSIVPSSTASAPAAESTPTPRPIPTATAQRTTGRGVLPVPIRVRIPRIKVDAPVEVVSVEPDGAMAAPRHYESVGWYGLGPIPGEAGAAVLAGHVDSKTGPAVFWSLKDLRPGDPIEVVRSDGRTITFTVDGLGWYTPAEAPMQTIFARDGSPRLNLVTCGGVFDRQIRAYSHRLVVYARLAHQATALDATLGRFLRSS